MDFEIAGRAVGPDYPTYFIADIAANHDGNIHRALDLISRAKDAGADAAKFQHFRAEHIVSDYGFKAMGKQLSHQANWNKSVFEVYKDASLDWDWTPRLAEHCQKVGIHFFSSPYDFGAVDHLEPYVPVYKIGSGDISWGGILEYMAKKNKPVILATGAAEIEEVVTAVETITPHNKRLAILQCNTNYTGSLENMRHLNLNVLKTYAVLFPDLVLGLSDHTPGHVSVLGAVALGGRIIEKHFTDDTARSGPDHHFSLTPATWRAMVVATRELEASLGGTIKHVAENEKQTVLLQRRCIRAAHDLKAGHVITQADVEFLRPVHPGALLPNQVDRLIGKKLNRDIVFGQSFQGNEVE